MIDFTPVLNGLRAGLTVKAACQATGILVHTFNNARIANSALNQTAIEAYATGAAARGKARGPSVGSRHSNDARRRTVNLTKPGKPVWSPRDIRPSA